MNSNSSYPNDERTRILRLVEDGALNASEAISLLENLGSGRRVNRPAPADAPVPPDAPETVSSAGANPASSVPQAHPNTGGGPRWFRVRVTDVASGRPKVSVNIPFMLASWGLRIGARFSPEVGEFNLEELSEMLQHDGIQGKIIDVIDEEDGEHVEIFVE